VADQVRSLYEHAVKNGVFVPRELVFFDLAVRGAKQSRSGLDQLRLALSNRHAKVLLLFATNRLFRKVFRTLEFVDQAVNEWQIRCIFVKSGIDTDERAKWQALLQVHAIIDQFAVTVYGDNIRAAQEGLFLAGIVHGTITFGYAGEPIPKRTKITMR